jgi:hypothetical protein
MNPAFTAIQVISQLNPVDFFFRCASESRGIKEATETAAPHQLSKVGGNVPKGGAP